MSKLGSVIVLIGCLLAGSTSAQAGASPGPDQRIEPWEAELRRRVAAYVQPTNADRTRVLVEQLRAAGFDPVIETFAGDDARTGAMIGSNVVATIGEGEREILMTAHYDAVTLRDGTLSHGVVDNAASVVAIIEAGVILRGKALNHRIRLIFTDQEELGLFGAERWVAAHGLANVAAVVNVDIGGYGDTLMYGQNNGPQSVEITRAVQELCAERAMPCLGYPVYPPSDDRVFSGRGLGAAPVAGGPVAPTVSLGFQDAVGAHQMWLAFNGGAESGLAPGFTPQVFRRIHSAEDTMEHVDPDTVHTAAQVYAALVERLDAWLSR